MSDELTVIEEAVVSPNGIYPQGVSTNGIYPQGINTNGIYPNEVTLNGVYPTGVNANGTQIGVAGSAAPLTGADLIGSTWTGLLSNGSTVALRIDDAMPGTGTNIDVWSYRMSVSADGTWRPLCIDRTGDPIFADTVTGTWNLAQGVPGGGSYHPATAEFTVACRGSTIAKCVELGYKPWTGHAHELAACVRALRGDYCGDGTPYTVTGTLVNIFDDAGIQTDDAAWEPEAEWTPDGAICISKKKAARFEQVAETRPACYPHALKPEKSCGTEFSGDIAIITELAPQ